MIRKLASLPSGRVAKWVVVAVWLVLLIPTSSLAGKLSDVKPGPRRSLGLPGL